MAKVNISVEPNITNMRYLLTKNDSRPLPNAVNRKFNVLSDYYLSK